ncbi:phage recombination protein Bet (plasmid) [Trichlorobacter lovleyi]|uniref:phage recombination protein Bet n=1 Tax=Trichlorobacter lovleyi TaxID=313985 RepID=UPI0022404A9E|nr:phage recombination protein Bet [Trichlorobacter lovleyi]QOX80873.1 phage recombination protein Bet [Trichlorobacter lovleyi]
MANNQGVQTLPAIVTQAFTPEQIEVIDRQFFPAGVSAAERDYCFSVAANLGLNPLVKEIMFVPRRQKIKENNTERWVEKIEPMVGRDGYLVIAHKNHAFDGVDATTCVKEVPKLVNGEWTMVKTLVATGRAYRKDFNRPFEVEVAYHEYVQTNADGKPTQFWASKPDTMLKKVAESQALRKAFNIHGVYSPEELGVGVVTEDGNLVLDKDSVSAPREDARPFQKAPADFSQQQTGAVVHEGAEQVIDAVIEGGGVVSDSVAETVVVGESVVGGQVAQASVGVASPAGEPVQELGLFDSMSAPTSVPVISHSQCQQLLEMVKDVGADEVGFLTHLGITTMYELPANRFGEAVTLLERKRVANEKAAAKEKEEAGKERMTMSQVLAALALRNIPVQTDEEAKLVHATPALDDKTSIALLKGMGFAKQGRSWVFQEK